MSTQTRDRSRGAAGWLLIAFAVLVLANTATAAQREGVTGADWSFTVLLAVVAGAAARSLWGGIRGAWWIAFTLAFLGLFFVLPVAGTILLGGAMEPIGTGWDVVFFPLSAIILVALIVTLWMSRKPTS